MYSLDSYSVHASVHIICTETHMYLLGSYCVHAASVLYTQKHMHTHACFLYHLLRQVIRETIRP